MLRRTCTLLVVLALVAFVRFNPPKAEASRMQSSVGYTLMAWNDLGMHCMDSDYAIFSILPPFNTIEAQLVDSEGTLVTSDSGLTLTYQAVADPSGVINSTSASKTNFWQYANALYGTTATTNEGIAGFDMPGALNTPQPMSFDSVAKLWRATGIPMTPYDDQGRKRYYPLMRVSAVIAFNGQTIATTDVVLPVSDELDCRACHASGANPDSMPTAGWVHQANSEYDYRANILRKHDEKQAGDPTFAAALAARGYSPNGLLDTVVSMNTPVLCAGCHASNALPGTGVLGVKPLTEAMHGFHATAVDPSTGLTLDNATNRSACYLCHPGSDTRCLRGAMGSAVAANGTLAMQCQNCHGNMSEVGDPTREGWLDQPSCQNCHAGNALVNPGQIRYQDAHDATGALRQAADPMFATNADVPATGYDLYRFSAGHGGLRCEACHGSTHAEYPGLHENDNLQSIDLQGHIGKLVECSSCHGGSPQTRDGGPHGMHPVGQPWVLDHKAQTQAGNYLDCRRCHGPAYRGSELSRVNITRVLQTPYGQKVFERGMQVSCFECHDGPTTTNPSDNQRPESEPIVTTLVSGNLTIPLQGFDPDGSSVTYRIVEQPAGGTVGLNGANAVYRPLPGFAGPDRFTYLTRDGSLESLPAEVIVNRGASSAVSSSGYPGTNGVPTLTTVQAPKIGTSFDLVIGNSWGMATDALIVHSAERRNLATFYGGTLWVRPDGIDLLGIGAMGLTAPVVVPNDPSLVGTSLHLQMVQFDPGAVFGVAFSRVLTLTFGD